MRFEFELALCFKRIYKLAPYYSDGANILLGGILGGEVDS